MKNRLFPILLILLALVAVPVLLSGVRRTAVSKPKTLSIVASFYPLAEFAERVGGEKVTVVNLTPAGIEPHDFEPTPQDLVRIRNAQVFIYNGAGFEPWVEKVLPDIEEGGTVVVRASMGVGLLSGNPDGTIGSATTVDPHIWLDPLLAEKQVDNIKDGLIRADPRNAAFYEANAATYKKELDALDADFRKGLADCRKKDIVTSHNAFAYLAKRYGLNVISISGLSPDAEPSPQRLAQITDFVKRNGIGYIFFETLVSPRLSDTIARETGARTLVFNPLEGLTVNEVSRGENYLLIQRQNLANLKKALECK